MADKKIPLAEATTEQLRQYADFSLGIKCPPNAKRETILSKVKQAQPTITFIEIEDDSEQRALDAQRQRRVVESSDQLAARAGEQLGEEAYRTRPTGKGTKASSSKGDPQVLLFIPQEDKPGGDRGKEVGVNGSMMFIPRGEQVWVPYRFYYALKCAVMSVFHKEQGSDQLIESKVPSVPFQVFEMPPLAEVREWLARIDEAETREREDAQAAEDRRSARRLGMAIA